MLWPRRLCQGAKTYTERRAATAPERQATVTIVQVPTSIVTRSSWATVTEPAGRPAL
jgi:hypothetical protein